MLFTPTAFTQTEKPGNRYLNAYIQYLDATCPIKKDSIKHFVYFARDREAIHDHPFLKIPRLEGAQIMYPWRMLEPEMGVYDFSSILEDFAYLRAHGKQLFIQLQDATFNPAYPGVPDYLLTEAYDGGAIYQLNDAGKPEGWVAKRWNPQVQARFAQLLEALGSALDGKIEGINLQETAIGVNQNADSTFSPEIYANAIKVNMLALKKAFPQSTAMQYANFMPGEWLPGDDKGFLRAVYQYGDSIGVSLGAPDLMVQRKGQLNHPIAMMHEGEFRVPLGIAVQDGNYIGQTGASTPLQQRDNLVPLLHAFAKDFLRVQYMFWTYEEPYFSEDLVPCFSED
ncbi:MAG: hypothetical protein H6574_02840 [Lewinellaceae bacterium]|nr:hypothetical protein [Lewinellaceae bacterium]